MSGPKDRLASAISSGQSSATVYAGDLADAGGPKLKDGQQPGEIVEVKAEDIRMLIDSKSAKETTKPQGKQKEPK